VKRPVITLLTDYGADSEFPGICHGVIRRICPDSNVIDISHGIRRHDIRQGALVLLSALPFMPVGVHVAIVDPQVGTERRAVAIRCGDGRILVGPDNGLLKPAVTASGFALDAVDISRSRHRLKPVSATFHGRDVFAPVAAALAAGAPLREAGDPLAVEDLTELELPRPSRDGETVVAHVLLVDVYGNVTLDLRHEDLPGTGLALGRPLLVTTNGQSRHATFAGTFADVPPGELLLYEDASHMLALAVNRGDAAAMLGLEPDSEVRLKPL
jgi:S-adenosyl-L-methionine hydrolase (adenosine-forming)